MENKLTDNEIIKALKCCKAVDGKCSECPYKGNRLCIGLLHNDTLDLINRRETKIEKLQSLIKEADQYFSKGDFTNGIAIIINLAKEMTDND